MNEANNMQMTLISDPTNDFPHNTNSKFKVCLKEPIQLPPTQRFEVALISASTPNQHFGVESFGLTADDEIFNIKFGVCQMPQKDSITYKTKSVTAGDFFAGGPIETGMGFFQRLSGQVQALIDYEINLIALLPGVTGEIRAYEDFSPRLDVEMQNNKAELHFYSRSGSGVNSYICEQLNLQLCLKMGFLIDIGNSYYKLGPNCTLFNVLERDNFRGFHRSMASEFGNGSQVITVAGGMVVFSRKYDWHFTGINEAFTRATTIKDRSLLVYSSLVQSSLMGEQKH